MSRKIPEDFIQTLLARVDIVDVVSTRVKLRRQGANYMGSCPFHSEKTASFSVSQPKQFYYCFGCAASGNAIGFLMNHDKLEFVEAVEELARFAGMDVPRVEMASPSSTSGTNRTEALQEVLEQAAAFYRQQLRSHPARDEAVQYLKNRGVTGVIAQEFGLGYAPEGWSNLLEALGGTPEKNQVLMEAGLLVQSESGKPYDRFRHRVLFPIRNRKGHVIGFGARALRPEDQPKYLNSPETPVFHKGSELYGLYELRQHKGLPEKIVITEGYMDVIALAQFGVWFSVATLGTATSKTHVETLLKHARELVFCFDGDRAGREAAWRALQVCLPLMNGDYNLRFLFLPASHDPDSFIRAQGTQAFLDAIDQAAPLSDVLLAHIKEPFALDSIESRAQFVRAALPYLNQLPDGPYRELLIAAVAEKAAIAQTQVTYQLKQAASPAAASPQIPSRPKATLGLVEYVTSWVIQHPALVQQLAFPDSLGESPRTQLLSELVAYIRLHPEVTTGALLGLPRFSASAAWLSELAMVEHNVSIGDVIPELKESLKKILKERDEKWLNDLIEKSRSQPLTVLEKQKISEFLKKD